MEDRQLGREQKVQESEYEFPYHYLDLIPKYAYQYRTQRSYRKLVRELIAPYVGQNVLDAGCGDRRFCYDLRQENVKLTGMDYSARALRFARAFCPEVNFIEGDLTQTRPPCKFDVILFVEVLEHFPMEKIPQVWLT